MMKAAPKLSNAFLCLALTLACGSVCAGQSNPKQTQTPAQAPVVVSIGEIRKLGQVGRAVVQYSTFDRETTVEIDLSGVARHQRHKVSLAAYYSAAGEGVARAETATFIVGLDSDTGVFKEGDGLAFVADGREFAAREVRREVFDGERDRPNEHLIGKVDFASFEQIANAKSVQVRAGSVAFELREGHRAALRDMLRALTTPLRK